MTESGARKKFRTVLKQFGLDEKVKIKFCENQLNGALGKVEAVVKHRIYLDQVLLTNPEQVDSDWAGLMVDFPDAVVDTLVAEDRLFVVFLHELVIS